MPVKKKTSKKDITLLEFLRGSLAEEEIRVVLEGALLSLDKSGIERLVKRLGKETGGTLRRVMDSYRKGISGSEPAPGKGPLIGQVLLFSGKGEMQETSSMLSAAAWTDASTPLNYRQVVSSAVE